MKKILVALLLISAIATSWVINHLFGHRSYHPTGFAYHFWQHQMK